MRSRWNFSIPSLLGVVDPVMRARWMHLAVVTLVLCGGCASWRETWIRPEHLIETEHPDKIGITLGDGSRLVLRHPEVRGDTLFGWWENPGSPDKGSRSGGMEPRRGSFTFPSRMEVVGIALSEITGTWLKDGSGGGSGILIVTGVIAVGVALLGIAFALSGGLM